MITVIQIIIPDTEPQHGRNVLIKALSAAIRWKAFYPENHRGDDENLVAISKLIDALTESGSPANG